MRQQINLYQPVSRQERQKFSAATVALIIGGVAIALAALSIHTTLDVKRLEREVATLRDQQQRQQAQLAEAGALQSSRGSVADIEARVTALKTTLAERTEALHVLQSGGAGQTTGFASRMQALARRHVAGLWIDALMMSGTTGSMSLRGGTLDAGIVPEYLHSLSREAVLSGTRFDDFVIERPPSVPDATAQKTEPQGKSKPPLTDHVRFRAGSKSLAAAQTETTP